jgi:hypothetical protein
MKRWAVSLAAIVFSLAIVATATPSEAWHFTWHTPPWGYPYGHLHGYPYPYIYAPPPVVVQPPQPQVYIQQQQPQPESYWYWCRNPEGYYPHVSQCASGWLKVVPQTSPPAQ